MLSHPAVAKHILLLGCFNVEKSLCVSHPHAHTTPAPPLLCSCAPWSCMVKLHETPATHPRLHLLQHALDTSLPTCIQYSFNTLCTQCTHYLLQLSGAQEQTRHPIHIKTYCNLLMHKYTCAACLTHGSISHSVLLLQQLPRLSNTLRCSAQMMALSHCKHQAWPGYHRLPKTMPELK